MPTAPPVYGGAAAPTAVTQPIGQPMQPVAQPVAAGYAAAPPGFASAPPPPPIAMGQVLSATVAPAMHTIVVPPGAVPGTMANLQLPDGRVVAVQLPPNAVPGMALQVSA